MPFYFFWQASGNDECGEDEDGEYEYIEEGPPEIIFQGNEIILRKNKVRVPKKSVVQMDGNEVNHHLGEHTIFSVLIFSRVLMRSLFCRFLTDLHQILYLREPKRVPIIRMLVLLNRFWRILHKKYPTLELSRCLLYLLIEMVLVLCIILMFLLVTLLCCYSLNPQDKAHCPFHLKTGACRFGPRCSRVHFYPNKSCTLLMKNMYNGPGIAWEQDEGLEVCNHCHLVMLVS